MGRAALSLALVATVAVLSACGSEEMPKLSDAKIANSLNLEQTEGGYRVGDNPFCRITEILNDADETSGLTKSQRRVAITSRSGDVGVLVKTPFAPSCKDEVTADLNKLDKEQTKKKG
jgi:hypothetical protein